MDVSPLQLVKLHRNRRYFVIKLHTWFCLSYFLKTNIQFLSIIFLEDKHKILLHLSIFYEYQQFFQQRICFSIQPPDYSDPWPRLARSSSFFLIMLSSSLFILEQWINSIFHASALIIGACLSTPSPILPQVLFY